MNKLRILLFLVLSATLLTDTMGQDEETEKPRLTIACLSDIHAMGTMISPSSGLLSDITVRSSFKRAIKAITENEDVDVMILGGDCQSDKTISEASAKQVVRVIAETSHAAFHDGKQPYVLWVTGNHDYEVANYTGTKVAVLPKPYNAGDFYTYPMRDDVGVLTADNAFWESAPNDSLGTMELLGAFHYQLYGLDFVVLNCGKNFFANAWDYTYSEESAQWVKDKLESIYADDPDKTVFFALHVPFPDSNSLNSGKGMNTGRAYDILKEALSAHPNLIMLYGHDHGYDDAFTHTLTSQRVTHYDVKGQVINTTDATHINGQLDSDTDPTVPLPDGSLQYGNFRLWNNYAQQYLAQANSTYGLASTPADVTVARKDTSFVFSMKSGSYNYNLALDNCYKRGNASMLRLYEVADTTPALPHAVLTDRLRTGHHYIVVGWRDGAPMAMSGSVYGDNEGMGMIRVEPSADSIIYKYPVSAKRLIWTFREGQDASDPTIADAEGRVRGGIFTLHNPYNDKFLAIDASNLTALKGEGLPVSMTETVGQYDLKMIYDGVSYGIHLGTGGRFSRADQNLTSMMLFAVDDTTQTQPRATRVRRIKPGETYILVSDADTACWAMSSSIYKAGTTDQRLNRVQIDVEGDTLHYRYANAKPLFWTLGEVTTESSFFSAFMGSMRYYYNSVDNADPADLPSIVQALMVYVYDDRVVLQMKNYNQTGLLRGIPVLQTPASYTSLRTVKFAPISDGVASPAQLLDSKTWTSAPVYDLTGRPVLRPTHGIYIQNGRKIAK